MFNKSLFCVVTLAVFLVLSMPASAFIFVYDCVNETHLGVTLILDGTAIEEDPVHCPYGCVENITSYGDDCAPTTYETTYTGGFIVIGLMIFVFSVPYVIKKYRRKKKKRGYF